MDPDQNLQLPTGTSPGQILRDARLQAGLSIQDVAQELRLSNTQVQCLEEDRYDDLPGLTYVRGYLRGYARLLKIDEDSVVPPLTVVETSATSDSGSFAPIAPRQVRSSDRHMRVATIVVLFAIVGGLVAWWQSRDHTRDRPFPMTAQNKNPGTPSEGAPLPVPSAMETQGPSATPLTENLTAATPVAHDAGGQSAAESLPAAPGAEQPKQKSAQGTGAVVPAETVAVAKPPTQPEATVAARKVKPRPKPPVQEVATPTPPQSLPAAVAEPGTKRIVFSFDGTSWVDVRDANEERLLYQSVTEGRSITVQGKPPFKIFLGNAKAVRIDYAGKPVDIAAYQTGLYARFVLGQAQ